MVIRFEEAADAVIAIHASTWKDGGKTEKRWRAILATYAFPRFGRKSIAAVTTADVLAMLVPHWATKRETMWKLRHEIGAIMRWAVAQGFREDNPAGESLGAALPKASQRRQHQRALPHAEVAGAIAKVQASEVWSATKLAVEFLTLTATRSGRERQVSRRVRSIKRMAQFRRNFQRVKRGASGRGSDALELVRIGSHAQLGQ